MKLGNCTNCSQHTFEKKYIPYIKQNQHIKNYKNVYLSIDTKYLHKYNENIKTTETERKRLKKTASDF